MLSTSRKQTLETEHTQNDKGRANQRKHGDKIDIV